jgi:hypothetical protein
MCRFLLENVPDLQNSHGVHVALTMEHSRERETVFQAVSGWLERRENGGLTFLHSDPDGQGALDLANGRVAKIQLYKPGNIRIDKDGQEWPGRRELVTVWNRYERIGDVWHDLDAHCGAPFHFEYNALSDSKGARRPGFWYSLDARFLRYDREEGAITMELLTVPKDKQAVLHNEVHVVQRMTRLSCHAEYDERAFSSNPRDKGVADERAKWVTSHFSPGTELEVCVKNGNQWRGAAPGGASGALAGEFVEVSRGHEDLPVLVLRDANGRYSFIYFDEIDHLRNAGYQAGGKPFQVGEPIFVQSNRNLGL